MKLTLNNLTTKDVPVLDNERQELRYFRLLDRVDVKVTKRKALKCELYLVCRTVNISSNEERKSDASNSDYCLKCNFTLTI